MSNNVDVVRSVVEALLQESYEQALDAFDAEAEWHNTSEFPGPSVCCGPGEIEAFWRALMEEFDRGGMEIEEMAEHGDAVAAGIHTWGRGKSSGAPIDVRWGSVYRLRNGKIVRVDVYGSYQRAVNAARDST